MSQQQFTPLTRHPAGSFMEVVAVTIPLIISSLSGGLMFFMDRIIVAHYSIDGLNALLIAGMASFIFHMPFIVIGGVSEVFVGQLNGSKQYNKIGAPVWQMIFFSLLSLLVYIPVGLWGAPYLITDIYLEDGGAYFQYMMLLGPAFPMVMSLTGFFVGRGKTQLVMWVNLLANLLNLLLGIILVYGIDGLIPEQGVGGAGLATMLSEIFVVLVLAFVFLSKDNRREFNTSKPVLDLSLFFKCLKIGGPNAINHALEMIALTVLVNMVALVGNPYITVLSVGQSFFVLFAFMTDAITKSGTTICANFIGGKQYQHIDQTLKSMVKFIFIIAMILGILFLFFPEQLVYMIISHEQVDLITSDVLYYCIQSLFWIWLFYIVDGLAWALFGVLTAAGDTLYMMYVGFINIWLINLGLTWFTIYYLRGSPAWVWAVPCIYGTLNFLCYYRRYKSNKWKKKISIYE